MSDTEYRLLRARSEQGVLILTLLEKEVRDYDLCMALREESVDALTRSQAKDVVFDFSAVEFMSSCGFLPLLNLKRKVSDLGGRIVLCNLSKDVRGMFQATRLLITPPTSTGLFEEQADIPAAIARL